MGASGEELIARATVFPGALEADALHSLPSVESFRPKETFVPDSLAGKVPVQQKTHML